MRKPSRHFLHPFFFALTPLLFGLFSLSAKASCGATFCTINTDWDAQGVWSDAAGRFDLHYEFINQHQLRSGGNTVNAEKITGETDEAATRNHNIIATWDYNVTPALGFSFVFPLVRRDHSHLLNTPAGPEPEQWRFNRVGDMRAIGRYQLPTIGQAGHAGFTLGLKLPTGQTTIRNPANQLAERPLQPGSGTTDFITGAYYRYSIPLSNSSWFSQVQLQTALNQNNNFKPGRKLSVDAGYLRQIAKNYGLMLQLNYSNRQKDSGNNAEPDASGSRVLAISPGVSYLWGADWQLYGFVQKPLSHNVNGTQLTSNWSLVVGLTTKF